MGRRRKMKAAEVIENDKMVGRNDCGLFTRSKFGGRMTL
jgi:hypothetical protein